MIKLTAIAGVGAGAVSRQWAEQAVAGNEAGNEVSASEHGSDLEEPLGNGQSLLGPSYSLQATPTH